ncbi:MAG TPA: hypothetical protein VIR15_17005, partial [Intrasporangium sp.]
MMTVDLPQARWAAEEWLLGFARALRAAGLPVTADRERTFLLAVTEVGLAERRQVYWTGRATLTSSPADVERYDQVFTSWFNADQPKQTRRVEREVPPAAQAGLEDAESGSGEEPSEDMVQARASGQEILRHRDLATLSIEERQALARLFGRLHPLTPRRRAR